MILLLWSKWNEKFECVARNQIPYSKSIRDYIFRWTQVECGGIMTRNGNCSKCECCGGASGCS